MVRRLVPLDQSLAALTRVCSRRSRFNNTNDFELTELGGAYRAVYHELSASPGDVYDETSCAAAHRPSSGTRCRLCTEARRSGSQGSISPKIWAVPALAATYRSRARFAPDAPAHAVDPRAWRVARQGRHHSAPVLALSSSAALTPMIRSRVSQFRADCRRLRSVLIRSRYLLLSWPQFVLRSTKLSAKSERREASSSCSAMPRKHSIVEIHWQCGSWLGLAAASAGCGGEDLINLRAAHCEIKHMSAPSSSVT